MSGHRPEAIMTTGKCSRCKGTFSFPQRTNKHHYCEPCKEVRARLSNQRYARKSRRKKTAEFIARLTPDKKFVDRWLWVDPTTTHIYRKDGPRRYVRVGTNGVLDVRKTKQKEETAQRGGVEVRAGE